MDRKIFVVREDYEYDYEAGFAEALGAYSKFEDAVSAVKSAAIDWLNADFELETKNMESIDFHTGELRLDNVGVEAPYDHVTLYIEEIELHE